MDGGDPAEDDQLAWMHSRVRSLLGGESNIDEAFDNKDDLPVPNTRGFSLRKGRDNFESPAWNQPPPPPGESAARVSGEWVGFKPDYLSFNDENEQPNQFKQQNISSILNVTISTSILHEPPTQLDLKKIASEFGNSFSGICSIGDLKAYLVSLSKTANQINLSKIRSPQQHKGWGHYDNKQYILEVVSEEELVVESSTRKGSTIYDHDILFNPESGVVLDNLSIKRLADKHREAADNRFGMMSGVNSDGEDEKSCEESFHAALEKFHDDHDGNSDSIDCFLWDTMQECLHRFQLIERSQPHLAAVTAAMAVGVDNPSIEVVGQLAGVLADEHASWKLLQHLHFHNLLLLEPVAPLALTDRKEVKSDVSLTDKEVVRQLLTPEAEDQELNDKYSDLPSRSIPCDIELLRVVVCKRWLEECFRVTADFFGYARAPSDVRKEARWSWTQEGLERALRFGRAQASTSTATASEVKSVDPDASFREADSLTDFLKLAVIDTEDERDLLLDVWRHLRSGDLQLAIEQCSSRSCQWRAAILAGGDLHGYTKSDSANEYRGLVELGLLREHSTMDDEHVNEEGNSSRSVWLNTCWHSGRMFSEQGAHADTSNSMSGAGVDRAVYAIEGAVLCCLTGDAQTLMSSPMLTRSAKPWEDRCWTVLKAMEVCAVQSVLSTHHQRQFLHSSLFPTSQECVDPLSVSCSISMDGCDSDELDHLSLVTQSLAHTMQSIKQQKHLTLGSSFDEHSKVSPVPNKKVIQTAGELCHALGWEQDGEVSTHRQVQVAAVMGPTALQSLFMPPSTTPVPSQTFAFNTAQQSPFSSVSGMAMLNVDEYSEPYLKRFACHLAIMLRELNVLTSEESLERSDDVIATYVYHLIDKSFIRLVALYCKYILSPQKRIDCYVKLMNGIQDRADRECCIELAFRYFPTDVETITRLVVENIRMVPSSEHKLLTPNTLASSKQSAPLSFTSPQPRQSKKIRFDTAATKPNDEVEDTSLATQFKPMIGILSSNDVTKIQSIEWLCISNEHKPEAVAQSNELLREFFNCTTQCHDQGWRIDAAELLVQSNQGVSDTSPPLAFPTMVLSRMEESCQEEASNPQTPSLAGGRSASEWGRILKEHQCWRVLLNAHQRFMSWHSCLARCLSHWPAIAHTAQLRPEATQEEIEEHMYTVRRDAVKNTQVIGRWITQTVGEMKREVEQACFALRRVLEFDGSVEAYGPCFGEVNYHSQVSHMIDLIEKCGIDPTGWMVFSRDHLVSDEKLTQLDEEEANKDRSLKQEIKTNQGGLLKDDEKAFFNYKMRERDQRYVDRKASQTIRRQVIPKLLLMLHEVYHSTGNWLLRVAAVTASSSGDSLLSHIDDLKEMAVNYFRSAVKVADIAASRQLGLYTCMDKTQLRRFLAAMHQSTMLLCELKGEAMLKD